MISNKGISDTSGFWPGVWGPINKTFKTSVVIYIDFGNITSHFRVSIFESGLAFDSTVMVLRCVPNFPLLSKTTSMLPVLPGAMGFLSHLATVHPQLADTESMSKLAFPRFSTVKICATFSPWTIFPTSYSSSLKYIKAVPSASACFSPGVLGCVWHPSININNAESQ